MQHLGATTVALLMLELSIVTLMIGTQKMFLHRFQMEDSDGSAIGNSIMVDNGQILKGKKVSFFCSIQSTLSRSDLFVVS